jgi:hypothetical protein
MEPVLTDTNHVPITPDDINELLRVNPVAAQQLLAITWRRIAMELEAKLGAKLAASLPTDSGEL